MTTPSPASLLGRRDFLAGAAALACLSATSPASLLAAHARTKLKLGLVTYNWGKDWDVPTLIKNCTATGFTGVELRTEHKHGVELKLTSAERKEVKKQFADSAVELVGLGSTCEYHAADQAVVQKNIEETKAFVKLCQDVGGTGVKVRPNGLPKNVPVEKTLEQIGKSLNEVGRYGADYGVQIRVEVHGPGTSEIPHMKTIMDVADHPNVVVCWNCNPQDLKGDGFEANYKTLDDRMGTVHIHDLRRDNYPWEQLFKFLLKCEAPGFTGWTLLEDNPAPSDIIAAMHENKQIFDQLSKA